MPCETVAIQRCITEFLSDPGNFIANHALKRVRQLSKLKLKEVYQNVTEKLYKNVY